MKYLLIVLSASFLVSCGTQRYCQPSKKSKDWAVQQWIKQRSDGYYVVYTVHGFRKETSVAFECKPDSFQLDSLRKVI